MAREVFEQEYRLVDRVSQGLRAIGDEIKGLRFSFTELNSAADLAGKGIRALGSVAGSIGNAVQGTANLEDALAALRAVTGASAEDFAKLKAAAVEASERTRFSAIEATQGLTELARAGLSATDAINVLNPALALAQGNNISVAQSSELLTTTIKQFGASMGEAARFADVLQATADGTATSVEQVGNAMSYAAPLARQLGLDIEQTSAVIGALAEQGFRGERAGTALRNVFSALSDPASKFSEALDKAGIQSRDFTTVIEQLAKRGDGAKSVLLALDSEARPAILSLVNSGGAAIAQLAEKFREAEGAAQRTSDVMGDTFNGALSRLQNTLTNLKDAFLEPLLAPLADELDQLSLKVREFAESDQFARLRDQFAAFATDAIQSMGDLLQSVDFTQLAAEISSFASDAKVVFDGLASVVSTTASAIRGVGEAIDYINQKYLELRRFVGEAEEAQGSFADGTLDVRAAMQKMREEAERAPGAVRAYRVEAGEAAESTGVYEQMLRKLAGAVGGLVDAAREAAGAARATRGATDELAQGADIAKLSMSALQERLRGVREALENATPGSDKFLALAREAGTLEGQIARTREQIEKAAESTRGLGNNANNTADNLRNFAGAAREAGAAAEDMGSKNSQVSKTFGNIGQQAAAAAADMGNMSQSLIELGLQMQARARNGKEIIDVWEGITRRSKEADAAIQNEINSLERRNSASNEELRIRRELEKRYGTDSVLLEKLVQLRLRDNQARQRSIELTHEEIVAAQQLAAVRAGALNFGDAQPTAEPTRATGTRGTTASAGGRGGADTSAAPAVTVVINGLPTDQAQWNQLVSDRILPALSRINRLSR